MRQPRPEMIAGAVEKDLRLVLQATEGAGMDDPRTIALELRAVSVARLGIFPAARIARFLGVGREDAPLVLLHLLARSPVHPRACFSNWRRSARLCARTANRSKIASRTVVMVSHAQTSQ